MMIPAAKVKSQGGIMARTVIIKNQKTSGNGEEKFATVVVDDSEAENFISATKAKGKFVAEQGSKS